MKRLLTLVLILILLGCTAIAEDVQVPVFIDGIRVAFFDADGNFLMQKKVDELVYVPLQSFCESLGMNAEIQGQSVSVNGMRIGMFDVSGNFLSPKQFDGIDYVPLLPFCEAVALNASVNEGKIHITRENTAQTVAEEKKESTGKIALHPYNFEDYFSYDIQTQNFKSTQTKYSLNGGLLYSNETEVDFVLTCNARSSFSIENVSFTVLADTWENDAAASGISGISFSEDMPANGSLTKTEHKTGTAFVSAGWKATKVSLKPVSLYAASGCIIVDDAKAEAANQASFALGEKYIDSGSYENALSVFSALVKIDYPQAAEKCNETREKIRLADEAAKKVEAEAKAKIEENYWKAVAMQEAGAYAAAITIYESLGDYQDSVKRIAECQRYVAYQTAIEKQKSGEFEEAMAIYEELGEFLDCQSKVFECKEALNEPIYQQAIEAVRDGNKEAAAALFESIKDYKDAAWQAQLLMAKFKSASSFHNGIAVVTDQDGKDYYVDKNGLPLYLGFKYDQLHDFNEGYGVVQRNEEIGKFQYNFYFTYVDTDGNIVIPEQQAGWAFGFHDGYARIRIDIKNNDGTLKGYEYFYIDKEGNKAPWGIFISAEDFQNGFALVVDKNKNRYILNASDGTKTPFSEYFPNYPQHMTPDSEIMIYGVYHALSAFYDSNGTQVGRFDKAYAFSEGYACVCKNDLWGFVDPQMQFVSPCKWQQVSSFSDGMAAVYDGSKWGFINNLGEEVVPCEWDYVGDFHEGRARVFRGTLKKNYPDEGAWGYIDRTGELIIPCEWDEAGDFNEGLACVIKEGSLTVLTSEDSLHESEASLESATEEGNMYAVGNSLPENEAVLYTTLKPGCDSQAVLDARMKLYELGYFKNKPTQTEYTTAMKDYVKKFEKDNGLKQDGILSPEDQEVLFSL
ncbi:MAG: WG repeat-containing protein [Clostridia bacterium]|nr:WG repeat-containing protein [Clostridia bacterium]